MAEGFPLLSQTSVNIFHIASCQTFPFSKFLKKVLYNRLIELLNRNDLLHSYQFGFRKGLSTEDPIFKLTHEILTALNNKVMVGGNFLRSG